MLKPRFIDVFAGCGGLSLGLSQAGWRGVFAVERHPHAFATLKHNLIDGDHGHYEWPAWLPLGPHSVEQLLEDHCERLLELRGSIDLVAGGPPCQGFSTAGRRNPNDPRNALVRQYLRFIEAVQPPLILMENVRGFKTMPIGPDATETYSEHVVAELRAMDYDVWTSLLVASDWGVPQRRPRFFVIAIKKGLTVGIDPFLRLKVARHAFLQSKELPPNAPVSASMALADLEIAGAALIPNIDGGIKAFLQIDYKEPDNISAYGKLCRLGAIGAPDGLRLPRHSATVAQRFETILSTCPLGRHLSDDDRARFPSLKRSITPLAPDQPSCTVTTLPDDILHYAEPRILTVRECARLQSFPDWFSFRGPYTTGGARRRDSCPRYTQVGNAVPPLLAEALGDTLISLLDSCEAQETSDAAYVGQMDCHVLA